MKRIDDEIIKFLNYDTPKSLFHYTSPDGFMGILGSSKGEEKIWSSDIRFLNDSSEYEHGLNLFRKNIDRKINILHDKFNQSYLRSLSKESRWKSILVYVTSFSEKGDMLNQWRSYCPQNNGVSIGFDFNALKNITDGTTSFILPCIYDENKINEIFKLISSYFDSVLNQRAKDSSKMDQYFYNLYARLFAATPMIKNNAFESEREWRIINIVVKDDSNIKYKFRKQNSLIIPYLETNLNPNKKDILTDIYIGPNPNIDLAIESTSMLLKHRSYNCEVVLSKVPYRKL